MRPRVVVSLCLLVPACLFAASTGAVTQYTITDLGALDVSGINASGQVVGHAYVASGIYHAFLWENGVMRDLGTLGGSSGSDAYGINASGQVVGSSYAAGGWAHAFLWEDGVMYDLNSLIPSGSGVLGGAYGINDLGQIVGVGRNPASRAFLLTPIPEPSVVALVALGALGLLLQRRAK